MPGGKMLHELMLVMLVAVAPHVLVSLFMLGNRDYIKHFLPWQRIATGLSHDLGLILLLTFIAAGLPQGAAAIGLAVAPADIPITAFWSVFLTIYLCLMFVIGRLRSRQVQEQREDMRRDLFETGGFADYRSLPERSLFMISFWLAVVAEELVFRGYLVLGLGARTDMTWLWIPVSITLSVLIHLYQGASREIVIGHVLFAGVFIAVSLATGNIVAAIIPHLVYDTLWVIKGWMAQDKVADQAAPV
jgi:hypothetical protein